MTLVKILVQLKREWSPDRFEIMMHGEWQPVGHPGAEGRTDPTGVPGGWDAIRKAVDAGAWPVKPKPATATSAPPPATPTPAPAPPPPPAARPAVVTAAYIVQGGDTLGRIAKAHGTTWQDLVKLNGIADPNMIAVSYTHLTLPTILLV